MHRQKRLILLVQFILAITLIGPIVGPVLAQSPGYLAAAPADRQSSQPWQENGLRLPDGESNTIDAPPALPASAGSLTELVPAGFNLQTSTNSATISTSGGAFLFTSFNMMLVVPDGAFAEPTQFTISLASGKQPAGVSQALQFSAIGLQTETILQPERPLLLAADTSNLALTPTSYFGHFDAANNSWTVPALTSHGPNLVSLQLPNLGQWALVAPDEAGGDVPSPWRYEWQVPAVSSFTGAATFQYPIELPAGRGNLTPNIDVSYNSAGLNGMVFFDGQDIGPLGNGWSLGHVEISRQLVEIKPNGNLFLHHGDEFSLVLNGQSYQLKRASAVGNVTRYIAINGPSLKIELHTVNPALQPGVNGHGQYWLVTAGNGTVYRLGFLEEAETGQSVPPTHLVLTGVQPAGFRPGYSPLRWQVDTITDSRGNQIQYGYVNWTTPPEHHGQPPAELTVLTDNARVAHIRYNFTAQAPDALTRVTSNYGSELRFQLTNDQRVDAIDIYHLDMTTPWRRIDFGLSGVFHDNNPCGQGHRSSRSYLVHSIQEIGVSGQGALPATTFTYNSLAHTNQTSCYRFEHLVAIDNGVGGRTEFSYADDGRQSPGWSSPIPLYGRSFFVTEQRVFDGVHNTPAIQQFTPTTPCYDQYDGAVGNLPGAFNCPRADQVNGYSYGHRPLVGFASMEQTWLDYDGSQLQRQITRFLQDRDHSGRVQRSESYAADGFLTSQQEILYATDAADITGDGLEDFDFTYAQTETATSFQRGGQATSTVTIHTYGRQNNRQFGNETRLEKIGMLGGSTERHHIVSRNFYPNEAAWLVSAIAREREYDGATLIGETRTSYDNRGWNKQPLKGLPTRIEQRIAAGQYSGQRFEYDSFANPIRLIDPLGNITTTTFDPLYHLYPVSSSNALGHTTTTAYCGLNINCDLLEPAGTLRRQTDPNGAATFYRYDSLGRLTFRYRSEADFAGNRPVEAHSYQLQAGGLSYTASWQRSQTGAAAWSTGGSWQREFVDGLGRPIQQQAAHTDWWAAGKFTGQRIIVDTLYDGAGRVIRQSAPYLLAAAGEGGPAYATPSQAVSHTFTDYDSAGNPVRQVALTGAVNTTVYGLHQVYNIDPERHLRVALRDDAGQLVGVDEALEPFRDEFDNRRLPGWTRQGNVSVNSGAVKLTGDGSWGTSIIRPVSNHPDWGVQFSFRGNQNNQEFYFFNDNGVWDTSSFHRWALAIRNGTIELLQTTGSSSQSISLLPYSANMDYRVVMRGDATSREFTVMIWPESKPEQVAAVTLAQPAGWAVSGWQFTALARTAGATIQLNDYSELTFSRTRYTYDLKGQLTQVLDAAGNVTTIEYDQMGRKIQLIDPDMGTWQYGYDAAGNLSWQRDSLGQTINFNYDTLHRLTARLAGSTVLASYGYDDQSGGNAGLGRRTSMTAYAPAGNNSATFHYDIHGQMLTEQRTVAGQQYEFRYEYTDGGLPSATYYPGTAHTAPAGWQYGEKVVTDYYWANGQPRALVGDGIYVDEASYNAAGQLTALRLGNNITQTFAYDNAFRLDAINSNAFSGAGGWLSYSYDGAGNITAILDRQAPAGGNQTQHFSYDALYRLTAAYTSGAPAGSYNEQYNYDVLGNLVQKGNMSQDYLGSQPHAVTHLNKSQTAWYDANGNMIERLDDMGRRWQQSWTVDNMLARATDPRLRGEDIGFVYDADSRLVLRRDYLRGQDTVQLGKLFSHNLATNLETRHYAFGGALVAMREAAEVSFFLRDHLGSTTTTLWANGLVRSDRRYTPWGELRWETSGTVTPTGYQYTSQRWDDKLGLYDYNARYYDPGTGRFLSADTLVPGKQFAALTGDYSEAALSQSVKTSRSQAPIALNSAVLNRFAYAQNRPLMGTDPTGHFTEWLQHFGWESWRADGGQIDLTVEQAQLIRDSLGEIKSAFDDISITAGVVGQILSVLGPLIAGLKMLFTNTAKAIEELSTAIGILLSMVNVDAAWLATAAAGAQLVTVAMIIVGVLLGLFALALHFTGVGLDGLVRGFDAALSHASPGDTIRLTVARNSFLADEVNLHVIDGQSGQMQHIYGDHAWGYLGEVLLYVMEVLADSSTTTVTYFYNGQVHYYTGNGNWY
ncbi:MAG: hypothetical protein H6651_11460 [Ardenticatenales bacterium]|nr:hypothetical protein [Ardenticatenales bacterium]